MSKSNHLAFSCEQRGIVAAADTQRGHRVHTDSGWGLEDVLMLWHWFDICVVRGSGWSICRTDPTSECRLVDRTRCRRARGPSMMLR